jgi:hypothetical protein
MKRSALLFFIALAAVCLVAPATAQQAAPYRVLISNDDGVRAPGLAAQGSDVWAVENGYVSITPMRVRGVRREAR